MGSTQRVQPQCADWSPLYSGPACLDQIPCHLTLLEWAHHLSPALCTWIRLCDASASPLMPDPGPMYLDCATCCPRLESRSAMPQPCAPNLSCRTMPSRPTMILTSLYIWQQGSGNLSPLPCCQIFRPWGTHARQGDIALQARSCPKTGG